MWSWGTQRCTELNSITWTAPLYPRRYRICVSLHYGMVNERTHLTGGAGIEKLIDDDNNQTNWEFSKKRPHTHRPFHSYILYRILYTIYVFPNFNGIVFPYFNLRWIELHTSVYRHHNLFKRWQQRLQDIPY